jgi:pyridoxine 5-phosphate synthase
MRIPATTALSVNVNKVALVRNTRHLGIPSVTRAAELCLRAGAAGITVHPRPDQRHIRRHDVLEIAELLTQWPTRELNIEGNPFHNLMELVRELKPHQATLVPDSEGQSTSDHGWSFPADAARLQPIVDECRALGVRVSLFMDPDPAAMQAVHALGAHRIELYTETWATAYGTTAATLVGETFANTAAAALDLQLGVNAGHDLNRDNLTSFLQTVRGVSEVSIGHALIGDALELGYDASVKAYLHCIAQAAPPAKTATS